VRVNDMRGLYNHAAARVARDAPPPAPRQVQSK
jgi:hypothetical protein